MEAAEGDVEDLVMDDAINLDKIKPKRKKKIQTILASATLTIDNKGRLLPARQGKLRDK